MKIGALLCTPHYSLFDFCKLWFWWYCWFLYVLRKYPPPEPDLRPPVFILLMMDLELHSEKHVVHFPATLREADGWGERPLASSGSAAVNLIFGVPDVSREVYRPFCSSSFYVHIKLPKESEN